MNVLLTGANGFVGRHLKSYFLGRALNVIAPVRSKNLFYEPDSDSYNFVGSLKEVTPEFLSSKEVDVVVHCAGLAHKPSIDSNLYIVINTELTLLLARNSAEAGVKRFIFISSIGVNGCLSYSSFTADDPPQPYDSYSRSKLLAEEGLIKIAEETDMEVVIIRPPLIYGKDAPGNFKKFTKLASFPIPKPFGAIRNKRSFVSINNLMDFIYLCLSHSAAANQVFLVSDGEDLSTADFLRKIAKALHKRPLLMSVPVTFLNTLGKLTGMQSLIDKLVVDLQVDIRKNEEVLGWKPPFSVDKSLKRAFSPK